MTGKIPKRGVDRGGGVSRVKKKGEIVWVGGGKNQKDQKKKGVAHYLKPLEAEKRKGPWKLSINQRAKNMDYALDVR